MNEKSEPDTVLVLPYRPRVPINAESEAMLAELGYVPVSLLRELYEGIGDPRFDLGTDLDDKICAVLGIEPRRKKDERP